LVAGDSPALHHLLLYSISMSKSSPKKARVISSREVYHGPAFRVTADEVLEPSGVHTRRDIVHHSGSVVILAVEDGHAEPRVLLERQYRHAARQLLWELPAGRIDKGENDLTAAKRELLEETGYTASRWRAILRFYASPGFLAETMNLYLARGLRAGQAQPEADEVIHIRMVPLSAVVRMVMRGTIKDGKTIAGILWLNQSLKDSKPRR
jgi:ADP-ribose pyrophosphatase